MGGSGNTRSDDAQIIVLQPEPAAKLSLLNRIVIFDHLIPDP